MKTEIAAKRGLTGALLGVVASIALVLAFVLTPSAALAEGPVAKVGDATYETFDEAYKTVEKSGGTIELLADCETKGLNLSGDLTIKGAGHTLTFVDKGIALWSVDLTFDNCNVVMDGVVSTPYTAEWGWMAICASKNSSLNLVNGTTMTLDGHGADKHVIYFTGNDVLNVIESKLVIKEYVQDALEWDGGDGGYNVNLKNATFISDHNRSGFTGTFYATFDNSNVQVINSRGNGSNGSHFVIKNGSVVDFSRSGSHGLSAGNLTVSDSTITANDNGLTGIVFNSKATFSNSKVTITGTKGTSYWNAGMRFLGKNASCSIDASTVMNITDNLVTGVFMDANTKLDIAEGAQVLITRNYAEQQNCSTEKDLARCGGGLVVRDGAQAQISSTTQIYNNHALLAGDDLYLEGANSSLAFTATHADWALDGDPDCTDAIDGWYDDSQVQTTEDADGNTLTTGGRWCAHVIEGKDVHAEAVEAGTIHGVAALKAAHGLAKVTYQWVSQDNPTDVTAPADATGLTYGTEFKAEPQQPSKGWTFAGWFVDEACAQPYVDGTQITGDLVLYGKWTKNPAPEKPADKPNTKPGKKPSGTLPKTGDELSSIAGVTAGACLIAAAAAVALRRGTNRAR